MFTVIPAMGIISAGQSQTINVDCVADKAGKHEEVRAPLADNISMFGQIA